MPHTIISAISAMAGASAPLETAGSLAHPQRPVIALSRDYGSGGDIIAARLAQRLGVPLCDEQVLAEVAVRLKNNPSVVKVLEDGIGKAADTWLYRFFSRSDLNQDAYRDTLVRVVLGLGRVGGVIVGRGAHLILAEACALRVRVTGSLEICARRMADRGHGTYDSQLKVAKETNLRRAGFITALFHTPSAWDTDRFDVTVNTDRMKDWEDVVEMLLGMSTAIHAGRVLEPESSQGHYSP